MNLPANSKFCWCIRLLPLGVIATTVAVTPLAPQAAPIGIPDDWSHHHVVFSAAGSASDAIRNGTYARWAAIVSDPRYQLQQRKRAAAAAAGTNLRFAAPAPDDAGENEPGLASVPSGEEASGTDSHLARGIFPAFPLGDERGKSPRHVHHRHRNRPRAPNDLRLDWSENMGSGATVGMGMYAAKYSFGTSAANCSSSPSPDFVVYNTSVEGTASQASIIAFDNLYSSCTGTVPSVYWAYDTAGGTIVTSATFSLDGRQVAFVQSSGTAASLVVLKWSPSSTLSVLASTSAASYRSCTAPCMTVIPFSNGANDSGSSVYENYAADVLYVGDDTGHLHQFTGVFGGTPAESGTPWPVSVSTGGEGLSSPVIDPGTGNILVGDYLVSGAPNCAAAGCGYFYNVNPSTAAVVRSARLDFIYGLVDGPLVDVNAETAYVFVGADSGFESSSSPCGSRVPCSGVFQFSTSFSSGASGTEARTGAGYEFMLSGTFDNQLFTSADPSSPTGNLYVIGDTGSANNTLYQIPIASNVMGKPVTGPAVSTNYTSGYMSAAMGLTEIFNGTDDYIFTSALIFAAPPACTSSLADGCVMGFNVTSGTISPSTTPIGASTAAGGASGIIIDNIAVAGSNIYFTPLSNQLCTTSSSTGGCAIQTSQSSP